MAGLFNYFEYREVPKPNFDTELVVSSVMQVLHSFQVKLFYLFILVPFPLKKEDAPKLPYKHNIEKVLLYAIFPLFYTMGYL